MELIDVKFPQPDKQRLVRDLLTILPRDSVLAKRKSSSPTSAMAWPCIATFR